MSTTQKLTPLLRKFFSENPDEILSFDDIAAKFDTTHEKARTACMHLRNEGTLQTMVVAMANPDRKR
jgi:hypothetical protein